MIGGITMFEYLDLGAFLTLCVFPFIGLLFNIGWVIRDRDKND